MARQLIGKDHSDVLTRTLCAIASASGPRGRVTPAPLCRPLAAASASLVRDKGRAALLLLPPTAPLAAVLHKEEEEEEEEGGKEKGGKEKEGDGKDNEEKKRRRRRVKRGIKEEQRVARERRR